MLYKDLSAKVNTSSKLARFRLSTPIDLADYDRWSSVRGIDALVWNEGVSDTETARSGAVCR